MAAKINPYLNTGSSTGNRNERNLIQTMVDEAIQMHGFILTYVVRDEEEIRNVWREDVTPEFTQSFTIEGALSHYDDWASGDGVTYDLFGLGLSQNATVQISKGRWREEHLLNPNIIPKEPLEGDLVLISFGSVEGVEDTFPKIVLGEHVEINRAKIFEIGEVKKDPIKWQIAGEYFYEIHMTIFDYSNEEIDLTNGGTEQNYLYDEQEKIDALSTSGLDAIFANIDAETGEETGNIKDVVKGAQNRDLEIEAIKVSDDDRRTPPVTLGDDGDSLMCDDELDGQPFELPKGW